MKQWVIVLPRLSDPPSRKWQLLGWESQGFSLSLFVNRIKNEGRNSLNHNHNHNHNHNPFWKLGEMNEMSLQEFQAPNHNPFLFLVLVALWNRSVLIIWWTRNWQIYLLQWWTCKEHLMHYQCGSCWIPQLTC